MRLLLGQAVNNFPFLDANASRMLFGTGGLNSMVAAAAQSNGKPSYAFRVLDNNQPQPVTFPADANTGPDIPKSMKKVCDLPHGDVVCAVTISHQNRQIYTGGKGCVKIWDIGQFSSASSPTPTEESSSVSPSLHNNNNSKLCPILNLECLQDCYIRSCKLYPDDSTLIVGGESELICIWDLKVFFYFLKNKTLKVFFF